MEAIEFERVQYQIEGMNTIVQFVKDDRTSLNSVSRPDERNIIVIGNRQYASVADNDPYVSELCMANYTDMAKAVVKVTEAFGQWSALSWEDRQNAEIDFGRVIEAYKKKASMDDLIPADADLIGIIHTARVDALIRSQRVELPA